MSSPSPGAQPVPSDPALLARIALIAPGTTLRDGLDRIVNGHTGALIVLGENDELRGLSTGGFAIDAPFTPTALRELAKMDGAITLSGDLTRIRAASVHLMPRAEIETAETGTRHRTADRVARQTGLPVVTVSASMATITLFTPSVRRTIEHPEHLMVGANQAVAALGRYRGRLDEELERLNLLELADQVTLHELALVAQRVELLRRLEAELDAYLVELGADGRLVSMQVRELMTGVDDLVTLLLRDYGRDPGDPELGRRLAALDPDAVLDLVRVARALDPGAPLDGPRRPLGLRQLATIPRLQARTIDRLIEHFGSLYDLFGVSAAELAAVDGVSLATARRVRDGLVRLVESSAYDQ